jgi:hypothetical protein
LFPDIEASYIMVYLTVLWVSQTISHPEEGWLVNIELERIKKEAAMV